MNPSNVVLFVIIAGILGLAAWYVIRAKKKGRKCIGCPSGGDCPHGGSCASCGSLDK